MEYGLAGTRGDDTLRKERTEVASIQGQSEMIDVKLLSRHT